MLYVIKFSEPLGDRMNPRGQAQFYLGWCEDGHVSERFRAHCQGVGAKITAAAVARGLQLELVLTMPGDRADESRLKKHYKNNRKLVERMLRKQQ